MTYRNRLLRPSALAYAAAYAEARADLTLLSFKHECALADLRKELEETRAAFEELKTAVRRRVAAEQELTRLREVQRAWTAAERNLSQPLQ